MRPVILLMYVVMALWLLIASVLRLVLSLATGVPLDALPFITGGLGLLALVMRAPAGVRALRGRGVSRAGLHEAAREGAAGQR